MITYSIQAYSASCVTLVYSQPCHILSPGIFRTKGIFKTLWNVYQAYSEPCHRSIFRHIQNLSKFLHTQKPGILRILEYSEPFHDCVLTHVQNPVIFIQKFTNIQSLTYLKPDTFIFRTLSRHTLIDSECCAMLTYWEPCHIQNLAHLGPKAYSESCFCRHIQAYLGIFSDSYDNINFLFFTLILHPFQQNLKCFLTIIRTLGLKNFLYFQKWNPTLFSPGSKNKKTYPKKISSSGNRNPQKPYIFSKESFLIFQETETP